MMKTNFSIIKAVAIIAVVVYHSCTIPYVGRFLGLFMIPVFFICSGYFFHTKYLGDAWAFVVRRFKGLYKPFVVWSVFFLLIHNLLFPLGILNEEIGNSAGGVLHPYTWHAFSQRLWSVVFNMSGYEEFLSGTFWFFRALFLVSIAFLLLFKLSKKVFRKATDAQLAWGILALTIVLTSWKLFENLKMTGVAQGGYRELVGMAFMCIGFLFRQYEERLINLMSWKFSLVAALLLVVFTIFYPVSVTFNANLWQFLSLLFTGSLGFGLLYQAAAVLDARDGRFKNCVVYIGNHTLYIFAFHFAAFKLVSAIKVAAYGLPWHYVGSHPVVHEGSPWDGFWLLYTTVGIGLPLLVRHCWRQWTEGVSVDVENYAIKAFDVTPIYAAKALMFAKRGILSFSRSFVGFFSTLFDIIKASNPKEDD